MHECESEYRWACNSREAACRNLFDQATLIESIVWLQEIEREKMTWRRFASCGLFRDRNTGDARPRDVGHGHLKQLGEQFERFAVPAPLCPRCIDRVIFTV